MRTWTPLELVGWTADYLTDKGIAEGRLNAEILLAGVLGLRRLDLYLQFERPLEPAELAEFKARLKRRIRNEPLQYIEGTATFRDLDLRVDPRVLIPRPETEQLVQRVLDWSAGKDGLDVVDIGTGSGAIALSLRAEGSFGRVVATDISDEALAVARENAGRLKLEKVEFRAGESLDPIAGERFDVVVSNPPYVGSGEALPPEVGEWEPKGALVAGEDGLDVIRQIVQGAHGYLNPGGLLALEIGCLQAEEVAALVARNPSFEAPVVYRDLAGRDRFVFAEACGGSATAPASDPEPKEQEFVRDN